MKRKETFFSILMLGLIFSAISFQSCQDSDQVAPVIVLEGPETLLLKLNERYTEFGISVYDNRDVNEDLTIEIINNVDTLEEEYFNAYGELIYMGVGATIEVGEFTVEYIVTDKSGNEATATRLVIVENEMSKFNRLFDVTKLNLTNPNVTYADYQLEIEVDENVNNRIWFPRFSNLQFFNIRVYADIVDNDVMIPTQVFPDQNNYVVEGSESAEGLAGTISRSDYRIEIKYLAANNTDGTQYFQENFVKF